MDRACKFRTDVIFSGPSSTCRLISDLPNVLLSRSIAAVDLRFILRSLLSALTHASRLSVQIIYLEGGPSQLELSCTGSASCFSFLSSHCKHSHVQYLLYPSLSHCLFLSFFVSLQFRLIFIVFGPFSTGKLPFSFFDALPCLTF